VSQTILTYPKKGTPIILNSASTEKKRTKT